MIPLLGISTFNQLEGFEKLIKSINFQIQTVSIIVNSTFEYFEQVRQLSKSDFVEKFEISFCPQNLGFGPSVNYHIKGYPSKDYWVFVEDDVEFGKNDLSQIYELMKTNDGVFCDKNAEYILFALNRNMIRKVGFFDENLYPANYEDNDYRNRIFLADVKVSHFNSSCLHNGVPVNMEGGGATGKSLPTEKLNRLIECFNLNRAYYERKWQSPELLKINEYLYDIDERSKKEFRL
jgi:hypothetical protein